MDGTSGIGCFSVKEEDVLGGLFWIRYFGFECLLP
jgi:hypothetical protein